MNKFKDRTQGFILGIMVGLIVAGGFFVLKLDDYFKELNFYKTLIHTFTSETKNSESVSFNKNEQDKNENKSAEKVQQRKSILVNDSTNKSILSKNLEMNEDSLFNALTGDSLKDNSAFSEEVVVRKDELMNTKTEEVINLNPTASRQETAKDSIRQKVGGIQDDKTSGKQLINMEFWQSPLNYKGYKLSKFKMILYGMPSENEIKLFKLEDNIYLKNSASVYKLDYSSDFRPYEKVTDETVITKLR